MKQRCEYSQMRRGKKTFMTEERIEKLNAIGFYWVSPRFHPPKKNQQSLSLPTELPDPLEQPPAPLQQPLPQPLQQPPQPLHQPPQHVDDEAHRQYNNFNMYGAV